MSSTMELTINQYKARLTQYVRRELPLRDPSITIVHCNADKLKIVHKELILHSRDLKERNLQWQYKFLNAERILFDILRVYGYIGGEDYAKTTSRDVLKRDLESSGKKDLIDQIEKEINSLKETTPSNNHPPFLILFNIHACYNFIQTKDLIARLINQKGVLVLILYLEGVRSGKKPAYINANYNVNTVYII